MTHENADGGRRQKQDARFDLIPYEALKAMALTFAGGERKYGRLDRDPHKANWKGLDITGEQSPISHALKHLALYAAGETTDPETGEPEDHLGHALANLAMMAWFVGNKGSRWHGMAYPEILATGAKKQGDGDESKDVLGSAVGSRYCGFACFDGQCGQCARCAPVKPGA